jgi:hypothetical protein
VPTPRNGGSHAELESIICIFTASPRADSHAYSRSYFIRDDGGHDTPRYARRRARRRVVLQKEGKHELCVPDSRAVSGGHERTRRHLRPTQASLERRSTHDVYFILKAPRLPDPRSQAATQLSYSRMRLRRRSQIRKIPTQGDRLFIAFISRYSIERRGRLFHFR